MALAKFFKNCELFLHTIVSTGIFVYGFFLGLSKFSLMGSGPEVGECHQYSRQCTQKPLDTAFAFALRLVCLICNE